MSWRGGAQHCCIRMAHEASVDAYLVLFLFLHIQHKTQETTLFLCEKRGFGIGLLTSEVSMRSSPHLATCCTMFSSGIYMLSFLLIGTVCITVCCIPSAHLPLFLAFAPSAHPQGASCVCSVIAYCRSEQGSLGWHMPGMLLALARKPSVIIVRAPAGSSDCVLSYRKQDVTYRHACFALVACVLSPTRRLHQGLWVEEFLQGQVQKRETRLISI